MLMLTNSVGVRLDLLRFVCGCLKNSRTQCVLIHRVGFNIDWNLSMMKRVVNAWLVFLLCSS